MGEYPALDEQEIARLQAERALSQKVLPVHLIVNVDQLLAG